jgi:hypothetical protein
MKTWSPWQPMTMEAEQAFLADVEQIKADMRARRERYRHAYDNAARTMSDAQFDHNTQIDEEGGPCPW